MNVFNENQIPVKEMESVGLHNGNQLKISDDIKDQLLKGQVTDFVTLEGIQVNNERINIDAKLSLQNAEDGPSLFFHPIYAKEQNHDLLSEEEQRYFKTGIHSKDISTFGKIVEYGQAPYQFDDRNENSFYIQLEKENGEVKNIWGVDLKNALEASGHGIGDTIAISHLGVENVTIPVDERDENGEIIGSKWINTKRNNWGIETYIPNKHEEKSVLFEFDEETKSYVGRESKQMYVPEEVNGLKLSEDQKKKYKEGQEVVLEDDTKIQASPVKGMRFNRTILIVSVIIDGGMTYFLLKAAHRIQQNRKEKKNLYNKTYNKAYKDALNKINVNLERQHKAAPNNQKILNDLNLVKREMNQIGISIPKQSPEKSVNSFKEKVNDPDLRRNAIEEEDRLRNEREDYSTKEQRSAGRGR